MDACAGGESEDAAYDRYRADLERQRDEAQATAARANSDVAAAQERRDQLQRDLDAHTWTTNPPGIGEMRRASDARNAAHRRSTNPDTIARNDERYDAALTERQRLRDGIAAEDDIIDGGQRAANQAASAQCALDEAERLRNGNPQNNPRVPGVNPYLGTDPATNQPVSQQIQSDIDSRRQTSTTANSSF